MNKKDNAEPKAHPILRDQLSTKRMPRTIVGTSACLRPETHETINIVVIGIGGQGALTMMEMLALAAERAEREIRVLSRVSLARLGGAGVCHIRLGPCKSAAIPVGEADILLTLEMSEVLRALPMARQGARAFVSCYQRLPIAAGVAGVAYPTQDEITRELAERGVTSLFVPERLPVELYRDPQMQQASRVNMSMLGVLCGSVDLLPRTVLEEAIALRLPQYAEQNVQMFEAGWQFARTAGRGVGQTADARSAATFDAG